ncbi:MAG: helix-turn-helix transcriptional regulator [bacterium]|nr:helix-turn-helix transcriptional regulator [bacterium]
MGEKKPTKKRRTRDAREGQEAAVQGQLSHVFQQLQEQIRAQGFTQRQVQEILGWGQSHISSLISRRALRVDHVIAICDVIGVPPGELFGSVRPIDRSSEQVLAELLTTLNHPRKLLGRFDDNAIMAAAKDRLDRARGIQRQYLRDLIQWCQSSIVLDQRADKRRATQRQQPPGAAPDRPSPLPRDQHLVFPSFRKYQRYRKTPGESEDD